MSKITLNTRKLENLTCTKSFHFGIEKLCPPETKTERENKTVEMELEDLIEKKFKALEKFKIENEMNQDFDILVNEKECKTKNIF